MKEAIKVLALAHIGRDPRLQMRVATSKEYIEQLAEVLAEGKEFDGPLPIVFQDSGGNNWLADGYQRAAAHELAEQKKMKCLVRPGSFREAQQFALSANARHGARRTNQDKCRAVEVALGDEEWGKLSDRAIAELCGVSQPFVSSVRKRSGDNGYQVSENRTGKDGKQYPAKQDNKKAEPAEPAASWDDAGEETESAKPEADTPVTVETQGESEDAEFTVVGSVGSETQNGKPEKPESKPERPRCPQGIVIPEDKIPTFAVLEKAKEANRLYRQLAGLLDEIAKSPGGEFMAKALQYTGLGEEAKYVCPHLRDSKRQLKFEMPDCCVCPYCEDKHPGKTDKKCVACHGRGWVRHGTMVQSLPPEMKQRIERLAAKDGEQ